MLVKEFLFDGIQLLCVRTCLARGIPLTFLQDWALETGTPPDWERLPAGAARDGFAPLSISGRAHWSVTTKP
jgi:hypothetical protein